MKQVRQIIMMFVLLLAAVLPACAQSGELENHGNKMRYTFTGGTITHTGTVMTATNNTYHTWQNIDVDVTIGTTIRGTIKRIVGPDDLDYNGRGPVRISYAAYNGDEIVSKDWQHSRNGCSISYTIPQGVTRVRLSMTYLVGGWNGCIEATIYYTVKPWSAPAPAPTPPPTDDCGCDYIKDDRGKYQFIDSHIRFNDLWGEVSYRPNWDEDDAYEFADIDVVLYECYRIRTKEESGAILGLEDMSTYVMKEESMLVIRTEDGNISKLDMLVGSMWGNIKKMAAGKSLEVEMTQCVCGINGTIFACEEKNGVSSIHLFAGKVTVTSKKTKKKYVMQPGQNTSVGKDGKIVVKKFNIEQEAKKFGIPMSEIRNHYSNTTTTATTKRYDVERAMVKYKVTTGTTQGVMAKVFDKYGQQERRELKMGNQTTLQLTQGNTSYNLDRQTKTYQQVTNAELNFLNMNAPVMQKLKLQKKGTAKVLNRECTVYANADTKYYVWKGIVLKKVAHTKKGTTTTEATSVELPASVDSKYFNMPAGYRKK